MGIKITTTKKIMGGDSSKDSRLKLDLN